MNQRTQMLQRHNRKTERIARPVANVAHVVVTEITVATAVANAAKVVAIKQPAKLTARQRTQHPLFKPR